MQTRSILMLLFLSSLLQSPLCASVLALSRGPLELDIAPRLEGDEIVEGKTETLGEGSYAVRLAVRREDGSYLGLWLSQPIASPGGPIEMRMAASEVLPGKPPLVFLAIKGRDAKMEKTAIYFLLRLTKGGLTRVCRAPSVGAWKKAKRIRVALAPKQLAIVYGKKRLRYRWMASHGRFRLKMPLKGAKTVPSLERPESAMESKKVITVNTVDQLLAALGSNRTIAVAPGTYVLSSAEQIQRGPVSWTKAYDGPELHLEKLVNCSIVGTGDEPSRIVTRPRYANVIHFDGCRAITMKNLVIGHEPKRGGCTGGVLVFRRSSELVFEGVTLFGCGVEGLTLEKVTKLVFRNSEIRDCTWSAMTAENCRSLEFIGSRMTRCNGGSVINLRDCDGATFKGCTISDNSAPRSDLFRIRNVKNIFVVEPTLERNNFRRLSNDFTLQEILESKM